MNIVELIKEEVLKIDIDDRKTRGYSYYEEHIKYVVATSKKLAIKYGADLEIVELSALLHDVSIIATLGPRDEHHIYGATMAEELLTKYNYPIDRIERVKQCILNHRGSVALTKNTIEEKIIADADAIAHFDNIPILFYTALRRKNLNMEDSKKWVKKKLNNDYNKLSDRTKEELKDRYENIMKVLFVGDEYE